MNSSSAFRTTALLLCIALPVQQAVALVPAKRQSSAPQTSTTLASNIPAQILHARTIFLANSGADPNFPIDPTRAYNDIYSAIQARGLYQLADSPAHADLVVQLRDLAPITDVNGYHGNVYSVTSPAFQLTIVDPASNVALWTITSPVTLAGKRQVFDHWVSLSETLVSRLEALSGRTLTPEETANLTTVPKFHRGRTALILVGTFVGLAAAGGLILHHEYENGLADMKSQQDAFCKANNIPLSECAGG